MAITQRAQRRLILLVLVFTFLAVVVLLASIGRNYIRDRNASDAQIEGLALFEEGKYKEALPKLSMAVAADKKNARLLATLAEARSRVVTPGGKYLNTAIDMFLVALSLEPDNKEYLEKLLDLQVRAGRLAQIIDTANQLLVLDPSNPKPVKILREIAEFRGRIGSIDESGQAVEEDSALFWQEKLIDFYPRDIWHRLSYLALLEQIGATKSELLTVAENWTDNNDGEDGRFEIILAQVNASADMMNEAARLARSAISRGLEDPRTLLLAIEIMSQLNLQDEVAQLKKAAADRALLEPELARAIILQAWRNGVTTEVIKYINEYTEVLTQDINDTIFLLKMAFSLAANEQVESLLPIFDEQIQDNKISIVEQVNLELWNSFFESLRNLDIINSDQKEILAAVENIKPIAEQISDREFIWFILAKLYQRAGLTDSAFDAYRYALDSSGVLHVVPGRALVEGLLTSGRPMQALSVSEMLVRRHPQSVGAFNSWVRTRAAMERSGISAAEEGAVLRPFDTSYSIANIIEDTDGTDINLQLLFVETALASKLFDDARGHIARVIDNSEASTTQLVLLARLSLGIADAEERIELLTAILERLKSKDTQFESLDMVTIMYATELRNANRIEEANALIVDHFSGRTDKNAQRLLALEAVDSSVRTQSDDLVENITALLPLDLDFQTIGRLMTQAINIGDIELANAIRNRGLEIFGGESRAGLLLETDLLLGFPVRASEVKPEIRSVSRLIGDLEAELDKSPNSPPLVFRQFRLLDLAYPDDPEPAIELLASMISVRPSAMAFYPPLISHLQDAGRYREADQYIDRFERRKMDTTPAIRSAVDVLRLEQGNPEQTLNALKATANAPDATEGQKLSFLRALIVSQKRDEAEKLLSQLMANPKRSIQVDLYAAQILARQGDTADAVEVLKTSPGFTSESRRIISIGSLIHSVGDSEAALLFLKENREASENTIQYQLLLSEILLAVGNIAEADTQLENVFNDESANDQQKLRVAVMYLSSPDLRQKSVELLAQLKKENIAPGQIDVMQLAFDSSSGVDNFDPNASHLDRSLSLIGAYPALMLTHDLAVKIHTAYIESLLNELQSIRFSRDSSKKGRRSEIRAEVVETRAVLLEILEDASKRFPMNWNFPRQLALQQYILGANVDALAAAKLAVSRSPIDRLDNAGVLAAIQIGLGRYKAATMALLPHVDQILTLDPKGISLNYRNLIEALLRSDDIDKAEEVLVMGEVSPSRLEHWISIGKTLDGNEALVSFDIFKSYVQPGIGTQIDCVNIATEIARLLNTPASLERAYAELEILESYSQSEESEEITTKQKVGLARGALQEIKSPDDAQATYLYVANLLSDDMVEKLNNFSSLSSEEKNTLLETRNLYIIALNNFAMSAARSGKNVQDGMDYINIALQIVPGQSQMLDTRATVHIALGDHASAIRDASMAIEASPNNLSMELTLVKAYILAGNFAEARLRIEDIANKNETSTSPSAAIRAELEQLERKIIRGKAA